MSLPPPATKQAKASDSRAEQRHGAGFRDRGRKSSRHFGEQDVSRNRPHREKSIGLKVIKQVSAAGPAEHSGLIPPVNVPIRMPALVKRLKLSPACTEPITTSSISPRSTETKTLVPAPIAQSGSEQAAGGPSVFSPIPLSWSGLPGGSSGLPSNGFSVMALSSIPLPDRNPAP